MKEKNSRVIGLHSKSFEILGEWLFHDSILIGECKSKQFTLIIVDIE